MTKAELITAIARYRDDQYVMVLTEKGQTIIQGVRDIPPWHPDPSMGNEQNLVAIVVHTQNKEL
jgi:hypothetical protein